ncbi:MAG: molybdenum cofactor biosynthesis protein MoaE [Wenzhouxiangella sp.]
MIHVDITEAVLDPLEALTHCASDAHGAADLFIGRVRNLNDGRSVTAVSYDLHPQLCRSIFGEICAEALDQWGKDLNVYLVHRQGRLDVGEASVITAVSSGHRDDSFKACRYLIEQMKVRAPIWKQEHYTDGDSEWIKGHALRTSD